MQADHILKLLPEMYRTSAPAGNVRDAVLAVMQAAHEPAEIALADLDRWFDPHRAPDAFVVMLAEWVALAPYLNTKEWHQENRRGRVSIDARQLRELVAHAAALARERGTEAGLRRFLELATGVQGFTIETEPTAPDGRREPFHVRVIAPAAARPQEQLVDLVLQREKPAFTTVDLRWAT